MLAKTLKRLRRKNRIRAKISGTSSRPRLSVFRSNSFIISKWPKIRKKGNKNWHGKSCLNWNG